MARLRHGTGLPRAVRRGIVNMKIQAYLTAAAINLKRLAAAILALLARGPVDLLVEVRHRRGRNSRDPQRLSDVLDPAYRDPGQIHLDQGFLDRPLAPSITLDDRRLKGLHP